MTSICSQRCLRERELLKVIPFSKSTLWRKIKDGTFPAPVKISTKVIVWLSDDIDHWFRSAELAHEERTQDA